MYLPESNQTPEPRRRWSELQIALTIILSTVLVLALCALVIKMDQSGPMTPVPTTWTTTHVFSGNGNMKTDIFTVPDTWRLSWECNPSSEYFGQYNVIVNVWNSDNTAIDRAAINTICQSGNTSGMTTEHQSGDIYLEVISEAEWSVQIQEFMS